MRSPLPYGMLFGVVLSPCLAAQVPIPRVRTDSFEFRIETQFPGERLELAGVLPKDHTRFSMSCRAAEFSAKHLIAEDPDLRAEAKVGRSLFRINRDNRFGHYIQWGRKFQPSRGASSTTYADAPFRQDSWSWAANFDWNSVLGDRFFFNTRYATFGYDWPNKAYGANGEVGTNLTNRRSENLTGNVAGSDSQDQNDRKRHQFDWTGTLLALALSFCSCCLASVDASMKSS